MPITITDPYALSDSNWVTDVIPGQGDMSVSTADPFSITFGVTPATSTLISENFKVMNAADYTEFLFKDISLDNDYSDITKTLTLTLYQELDTETDYLFVMSGIYDAAGNEIPRPHVVSFRTTDIASMIPEEVDEPDLIRGEDHTLVDYDISIGTTSAAVSATRSDPTDESYNVVETYDPVVIYFSETPQDTTYVTVEYRIISEFETVWTDSTSGATINIVGDTIEINLEQVGGDSVAPGYEYRITIGTGTEFLDDTPASVYLTEEYILTFCGVLDPMFSSVNQVIMIYPGYGSYEVAKMIYIMSSQAAGMNTGIDITDPTTWPRAAMDYVTYMTLFRVGSSYGDASMIQLGDLIVEKPDDGLLQTWLELAMKAQGKLGRVKPTYAIKGEDHTSPHAARDWDVDDGGTTKTRIGETT